MPEVIELSNRERDVVKLLQQGNSNKLIAAALGISNSTVEFHLKNIYAKYQVSSRMELVLKLGKSTVDDIGENTENRDKFNPWKDWAASLRDKISIFSKELEMNNSVSSNAASETTEMTFYKSILVCLTKYADFNGRASRPEFWWFSLFIVLVSGALEYLSQNLSAVFFIAMLLPYLAAGARRLHDIGKSGWWLLYLLVPVGGIIILTWYWALPQTSLAGDQS